MKTVVVRNIKRSDAALVKRLGALGVATASLYAATGLLLMLFITLHWRADLWHIHAPANAR